MGQPKAQKSMAVKQKESRERMAATGEILDYLGVLPGTFVPPTGRNLPSLSSDWRGRRTILYYQLLSWYHVLQSRFIAFWLVKPRLKLEKAQTPAIAQELYKDMYTALAGGEVELGKIERRLHPGLKSSLRARIAQRAPNTFMQWKLHRYMAPRECVYFKFGLLDMSGPRTERTGMIQAVVRIKSQQSLLTFQRRRIKDPANPRGPPVMTEVPVDRDGKVIVDFDQEVEERQSLKTVEEYFVIERTLFKGVLGPWRAWGTTHETTLAEIRKMEKAKAR